MSSTLGQRGTAIEVVPEESSEYVGQTHGFVEQSGAGGRAHSANVENSQWKSCMMSHYLQIILFLSGQWNMRARSIIARTGTRVQGEQHSNIAVESHRGEHYRLSETM